MSPRQLLTRDALLFSINFSILFFDILQPITTENELLVSVTVLCAGLVSFLHAETDLCQIHFEAFFFVCFCGVLIAMFC